MFRIPTDHPLGTGQLNTCLLCSGLPVIDAFLTSASCLLIIFTLSKLFLIFFHDFLLWDKSTTDCHNMKNRKKLTHVIKRQHLVHDDAIAFTHIDRDEWIKGLFKCLNGSTCDFKWSDSFVVNNWVNKDHMSKGIHHKSNFI